MQIGIMSRTFFRPTLEEELDAVVDHGLSCMQFDLSSAGISHLPDPIDDGICDSIRREMNTRKITMAAVNGMVNMIDPDMEKRRDGLRLIETVASACDGLGTSIVTLCTGSRNPRSMWLPHPDNSSPEAWTDLISSMKQAVKIAEKYGVTLAFEPEVDNVIDSAQRARRLLDEIGSPLLKVVMDGANTFHKGELPRMREILDEAFELLGEDVALAHAKDLDHDGAAGHLAAGTGVLDYDHYLSLLSNLETEVPLILHGLTEEQTDGCIAFLQSKMP